jgi:hypothetical protein
VRPLPVFLFILLSLFFASRTAFAHKPSDSYLTLTVEGGGDGTKPVRIAGRWDIAIRDLNNVLGLDRDGSGTVTWGELRARQSDIQELALRRLSLRADGAACVENMGDMRVASHSDGAYAVLAFTAICGLHFSELGVDYSLFFDVDPQHHGIVRIDDGAGTRTAIFTATERSQRFERSTLGKGRQLWAAVRLGITHIFSGIDHLLFLIALLLPSVLVRHGRHVRASAAAWSTVGGGWQPVQSLRPALLDVLKIVTSFTLAHSITLSLSALQVLQLPSRFVESGIAASVIVAALNNVYPILEEDRWTAAFALGLLHGFGFSATLMDLGLPRQNLVLTLFGFNVGVEIGQMCVVAIFLPLAFLARRTLAYRRAGLVGGSMAIATVASVWLVERAFAVRIF